MTHRDGDARTAPLVILNPVAGSVEDRREVEARIARVLGGPVQSTSGAGDARALARAAARDGRPLVVAAGGDGTVSEVVQGLAAGRADGGDPPVLAIVPLGTGNDLARCLAVPLDPDAALELAARPAGEVHTRPLDLVRMEVDGESMQAVNAVVAGNGGRLGQILDPEMKARWGPLSYLRSAGEVAFHLTPIPVRMTLDDGEPVENDTLNVVVANGRFAGGGIPIAPGADPSDGRLEVVRVTPAPLPRLLGLLPSLLRQEDPEADFYNHRHASRVSLVRTDGGTMPLSVDGEHMEGREVEVSVEPAVVRVRVPAPGD